MPKWATANLICYLKIPLGMIMGIFIYFKSSHFLLICFLIWLFGKFLDNIDGGIARYRKTSSFKGKMLDAFTDRVVLFILTYAALVAFPEAWILFWAMVFMGLLTIADIGRIIIHKYKEESQKTDFFWQIIEIIYRAIFSAIFLGQYLYYY
ncbi:MAG: CDP-alcohol phosphatidyltransferase family protein [Patescibacteria group bacterium]